MTTNGPGYGVKDVDLPGESLQYEALPTPEKRRPDDAGARDRKVSNMMGGKGQLIKRPGICEAFFGASSGFSFVCHTLDLFLKDSEATPSMSSVQASMLEVFDGDNPAKWGLDYHQFNEKDLQRFELPIRGTSVRLLESLFSRCSLVAQFLKASDIREIMDRIYQTGALHHEASNQPDLVLVHSLLALGYLYYVHMHRTEGCRAIVTKA